MLVDDTPNGAFTVGMADRLQQRLAADGIAVSRISIKELADKVPAGYYASKVAEALATQPDLLYVSTYFPEGAEIAKALAAAGTAPRCLMGLANVDPGFVSAPASRRASAASSAACRPRPSCPRRQAFVRRYRKAFKREPGVWGVFTYDSARILFRAIAKAGGTGFARLQNRLKHTKGYRGQTGTTTIDPATGYRDEAAVPEHPERGQREALRDRAIAGTGIGPPRTKQAPNSGGPPRCERTCHRESKLSPGPSVLSRICIGDYSRLS